MEEIPYIAWLVCVCLLGNCIKGVTFDPCIQHEIFPEDSLGSRNEKCSRPSPAHRICDYRLYPAWYSIPHNGYLLNQCPANGECGTEFPVWMQGDVPSVTDGIVNRTGCIQMRCDCCADNVTIQVKNCTNKIVYYLPTLSYCDSVYCIGTSLPCETTTTTIKTTSVVPRTSSQTITFDIDCKCKESEVTRGNVIIICIAVFIIGLAAGAGTVYVYIRYKYNFMFCNFICNQKIPQPVQVMHQEDNKDKKSISKVFPL